MNDAPGTFFECGEVTDIDGARVTIVRGGDTRVISFEGNAGELARVQQGQEISVKVRQTREGLSALQIDDPVAREFE